MLLLDQVFDARAPMADIGRCTQSCSFRVEFVGDSKVMYSVDGLVVVETKDNGRSPAPAESDYG